MAAEASSFRNRFERVEAVSEPAAKQDDANAKHRAIAKKRIEKGWRCMNVSSRLRFSDCHDSGFKLHVCPEAFPVGVQLNLTPFFWEPTASIGTIMRLNFLLTFNQNQDPKRPSLPPSLLLKLPDLFERWSYLNCRVAHRKPDGVSYFSAFDERGYGVAIMENYRFKENPRWDPTWARVRIYKNCKQLRLAFVQLT
jgi:hypothetical protein